MTTTALPLSAGLINGHPTEKISQFIDFHLRLFVENLPTHIKDTTDYLVVFLVNVRQQIETAWLGILWSKVLHGLIVYVATNMHSL
jgi:hypothetical protein